MERNEGRGRVAVVTGGASGIGHATARVLIDRGWHVVISDVNADANAQAAQAIGAESVPFDVVDEVATKAVLADIESRVGPIEALFAERRRDPDRRAPRGTAAGRVRQGRRRQPERRVRVVHQRGCVDGSAQTRRHRDHGLGHVVAHRPLHAYAPAKAAVVHMAACLAAEWGRSGIRVNAVSPGYVGTPPLMANIQRGRRDPKLLIESSALGRLVEPDEIGKSVAFLLSDDASAVTGINLPVDAGWLAGSHLTTYGGVRAAP